MEENTEVRDEPAGNEDRPVVWMVYEDNEKWAIRVQPCFTVKATREEIHWFLRDLNTSRMVIGKGIDDSTRMTASVVRSFDSVDDYRAAEETYIDMLREHEFLHRSRVAFAEKKI